MAGLLRSTNQGLQYSEINDIEYPLCIDIVSNQIYIGAGFGNGIYKSTDNGSTWTQKNNGLPVFGSDICQILSISIDPNNTNTVWAGTQHRGGIVKTTNGGDLWQVMGLTDANYIDAIAINLDNSNEVLVGGGFSYGNIYKSTDGGSSWNTVVSQIPFVMDIEYNHIKSQLVFAATEGGGVIRSFDGGETWYDFSTGIFYPMLYSLDISQDTTPFLVAGSYGSGLYWVTFDGMGITQEPSNRIELCASPNPFYYSASISFELSEPGFTSIAVYDLSGRVICSLNDSELDAGEHSMRWNGRGHDGEPVSAGLYFCRILSGSISETIGLCLLR